MEYKIAILGNNEEILGFKALGVSTFPISSKSEAEQLFEKIIQKGGYAVVFVTENWAEKISETLFEHRGALPAVVTIPNYSGGKGMGEAKLRNIVEKAVGSDILFKDKK
jgi:V/A-type H+-transporting ATPase subunit F